MCETNILYYLCGCYVKDVRRSGCGPYLQTQDPHCEYMDRYEDRRMEECYDCAAETKRVEEGLATEKARGENVEGDSESGEEEEGSEEEVSEDKGSKEEFLENVVEEKVENEDEDEEEGKATEEVKVETA